MFEGKITRSVWPSLVVIGLKLFIWDHFFKTLTKMSHTYTPPHTHTQTDRNSDCIVSFPEQVQTRQKVTNRTSVFSVIGLPVHSWVLSVYCWVPHPHDWFRVIFAAPCELHCLCLSGRGIVDWAVEISCQRPGTLPAMLLDQTCNACVQFGYKMTGYQFYYNVINHFSVITNTFHIRMCNAIFYLPVTLGEPWCTSYIFSFLLFFLFLLFFSPFPFFSLSFSPFLKWLPYF